MKKLFQFLAAAAVVAFGAVSCDKNGSTPEEEDIDGLVEIRVLHKTSVTLEVKVVKGKECSKYVVGASKKLTESDYDENGNYVETPVMIPLFSEKDFIEQAERSVEAYEEYAKGEQGDHFKMYAPYLVSDKTDTYNDYNLVYGKYLDKPEAECQGLPLEAGQEYVIAVYAYDQQGVPTLITEEVTVEQETAVTGNIDVNIEFLNVETSYTSVTAKFTAGEGCARLFYGISVPDEYAGEGSKDMDEMTDKEFEECLLTLSLGQSHIYNGPATAVLKDNIEPGSRRVVWAIAVDSEGKIGKIARKTFTAPAYKPSGTGKITGAELVNAADGKSVDITIRTDANAKTVRLLPVSTKDWQEQFQTFSEERLDYLLYLTKEDGGGAYKEIEVKDGKAVINFKFIEDRAGFYFFAATVDADGLISPYTDLVKTYAKIDTGIWAVPQEGGTGDDALTFNGNGRIMVEFDEKITSGFDGTVASYTFTVTKGENAKAVYYFKLPNLSNSDIAALLIERCNGTKAGVKEEADFTPTFEGDAKTTSFSNNFTKFYTPYVEGVGGDAAVFIVEDNDGNFSIGAQFLAGGMVDGKEQTGQIYNF